RRLDDWLHAGLSGSFEVRELVVGPDLATVHVYGVEIAPSPDEPPVIQADAAHAGAAPIELLRTGRIVVPWGRAEGAKVRLAFGADGEFNLQEALGIDPSEGPARPSRPIPIVFRHVETWNSRFEFVRPEFTFTVPEVDVPHTRLAIMGSHLEIGVDRLNVPEVNFRFFPELFGFRPDYGDWTFTVDDVRVRNWRWNDREFRTGRVAFRAEGARVRASGRMGFPRTSGDEPRMTYSGKGRVSVPYWSPLVQYFVRDSVHFHTPRIEVAVEGDLQLIDGIAHLRADLLEAAGEKHGMKLVGVEYLSTDPNET
ncbi:MAG: hypothetical protein ABEL76_17430, partial [Bradymonadaceae bacterium]